MAYKTGSITRFIMPANLVMCAASSAAVFFFVNQDYLAGWIALLITWLMLLGVPGYTKRILDNTFCLSVPIMIQILQLICKSPVLLMNYRR